MVEQELTWVGLRVGEYMIDQAIGEGAFSTVFHGTHLESGQPAAFKVAKPSDIISSQPVVQKSPSQAIGFYTGGIQGVTPDAVELLKAQVNKMRAADDAAFPRIDKLVAEEGFAYYQMELLDGHTLRAQLQSNIVEVSTLVEIARVLDRLSKISDFRFHGDLKPENIMLTSSGIRILDPGYFGELQCLEGYFFNAAVTTPAYYPLVEPDDLLAFGLMLWEAATGRHPLMAELVDGSNFKELFTPQLIQWVRSYEQVGLYFLRSIYELRLPSEARSDLTNDVDQVLLKSLGLSVDSGGRIDRCDRFDSFAAVADALQSLADAGQTEL